MSTLPQEPTEFQEEITDAFNEYMVERGFYIKEGNTFITNPKYPYSIESLKADWLKEKKERFGTTSNQEPK